MKIINFKSVLGLAAIGAFAYARKHGGFKEAFKGLLAKKDELLAKKDELLVKQDEPVPVQAPEVASSYSSTIPSVSKPFSKPSF